MATTLYLQNGILPPVTPNFSSSWSGVVAASATWNTADTQKHGTTMGNCTNISALGGSGTQTLGRLSFVYGPFTGAGSSPVTGYIDAQMRGYESNTSYNGTWAMNVRVVYGSSSPFSVRGTCLAINYATPNAAPPEWTTTLTNRRFRGGTTSNTITPTLTNVTPSSGDYLVIEMGAAEVGTTTSRYSYLSYGDDSGTDLANNDTTTNAYNPWVSFSSDLPPIFEVVRTNNTIAITSTVPTASVNVIKNITGAIAPTNKLASNFANGFESGTPSDYEVYGSPTITADSSNKYSGSYCIKYIGNPTDQINSQPQSPILPNTQYTASCQAKVSSGTSTLYIVWWDATGSWISNSGQTFSNTSYSKITKTATSPANAYYATLCINGDAGTNTTYFDESQLEFGASATAWSDPGLSRGIAITVPTASLTKPPLQTTGSVAITSNVPTASTKITKKLYSSAAVPATVSLVTASSKATKKLYSSAAVPATVSLVTASSKATKKLYSSTSIPIAVTVPSASATVSAAIKNITGSTALTLSLATASSKATKPITGSIVRSPNITTANQATGTDTSGDTTGFEAYRSTTISSSTTQAWQGTKSLKIITPGSQGYEGIDLPTINITNGQTYTFSANIYAQVGVNYCFTFLDAESGFTDSTQFTGTGAWQWSSYTKTNILSDTLIIFITTGTVTAATTFYVDGIQLETGSATSWQLPGSGGVAVTVPSASATVSAAIKNITGSAALTLSLATASSKATKKLYSSSSNLLASNVANGCEDGTTAGWTNENTGTNSADSSNEYSGSYCLKVTCPTQYDSAYTTQFIPVVTGNSYTLSGMLKNPTAGGTVRVDILWADDSKTTFAESNAYYTHSDTYQFFNVTDTAPTNAVYAIIRFVSFNASASEFYLDELQLESGTSATAWSDPRTNISIAVAVPSASATVSAAIKNITGSAALTLSLATVSSKATKKLYSSAAVPATVTLATASSKATKKLYSSAAVPATVSLVTASSKATKKLYSSAAIPVTVSLVTASSKATKKLYSSAAVPVTVSLVTASSKATKKLYSSAAVPITTTTSSPILRYSVGTLRGQTIPVTLNVPTASSKATKKLYSSATIPITITTSSASASVVKIVGISASITLAVPTVTGRVNYNKASLKPTAYVPIALTTSTVSTKSTKKLYSSAAIPVTVSLVTASSKATKKLYSSAVVPVTVSLVTASSKVVKIVGSSASIPVTVSLVTASSKATKKLYSSAAVPITGTLPTTSLRYVLGRLSTQTIPIAVSLSSASTKASKTIRPSATVPLTVNALTSVLTILSGYKYTTGTSAITVTLSTASSKANRKMTPTGAIGVTTSTSGRVNYNKASFRSSAPIPLAIGVPTPALQASKRTGGSAAIVLTVPSAAGKRYRGLSVNIPAITIATNIPSLKARWALNGNTAIQITVPITSTLIRKVVGYTTPITVVISTSNPSLINYVVGLIHAHIIPRGPSIKIRNQNPGIEIMGAEGTCSFTNQN